MRVRIIPNLHQLGWSISLITSNGKSECDIRPEAKKDWKSKDSLWQYEISAIESQNQLDRKITISRFLCLVSFIV